jgi:hypothetical protein
VVDRSSRDKAAVLVRQFKECQITNDEFERRYPRDSHDLAVRRIYERIWCFYDDLSTHKLEGRHALSSEAQGLFERCALFLESDREYEWPPDPLASPWGLLRWLPPARRKMEQQEREFQSAGDFEVWPFLRRGDYEKELIRRKE